MRVWIPPFEDAERNLVQGHWVHVVIGDEGWYITEQVASVTAHLPYTASTPHTAPARSKRGGRQCPRCTSRHCGNGRPVRRPFLPVCRTSPVLRMRCCSPIVWASYRALAACGNSTPSVS